MRLTNQVSVIVSLTWLTGCVSTSVTPVVPQPEIVTPSLAPALAEVTASATTWAGHPNTATPATPRPPTPANGCFGAASFASASPVVGKLVFGQHSAIPAHLKDIATGEVTPLPSGNLGSLVVSPTGEYLAFVSYEDDNQSPTPPILRVLNTQGALVASVTFEPRWDSLSRGWLNERQLLITTSRPRDDYETTAQTLIVLDPFERTATQLVLAYQDFPDVVASGSFIPWGVTYAPSPRLDRVVYPSLDGKSYIVRALPDEEALTSIPTYDAWSYAPIWSHAGDRFVVVQAIETDAALKREFGPPGELIIVDSANVARVATDFASIFDAYDFLFYQWSPNDRYVAMWMVLDPPQPQDPLRQVHLVILDVVTNKWRRYCVSDDKRDGRNAIIWAPSSDHLILRATSPDGGSQSPVIVDRLTGEMMPMSDAAVPEGWLRP